MGHLDPTCCGEPMEPLGSGVWECDPCGCLTSTADGDLLDTRQCPDHTES
ncbi:hypothetical protein [Actinacidiphila yeochonensis]|nr:hypothetical protein [Actinacidiphila yeochonensis]